MLQQVLSCEFNTMSVAELIERCSKSSENFPLIERPRQIDEDGWHILCVGNNGLDRVIGEQKPENGLCNHLKTIIVHEKRLDPESPMIAIRVRMDRSSLVGPKIIDVASLLSGNQLRLVSRSHSQQLEESDHHYAHTFGVRLIKPDKTESESAVKQSRALIAGVGDKIDQIYTRENTLIILRWVFAQTPQA